jgi:hypothetical protein
MVLVALASSARNLGRAAAGRRARLRAIMLLLELIRMLAILSRGAGSAKSFCARVLVRHLSILLMTRLARVTEVCWIFNNQLEQWFLLGLLLIWIHFSGSGLRRLTQLRFPWACCMQAAEPAMCGRGPLWHCALRVPRAPCRLPPSTPSVVLPRCAPIVRSSNLVMAPVSRSTE